MKQRGVLREVKNICSVIRIKSSQLVQENVRIITMSTRHTASTSMYSLTFRRSVVCGMRAACGGPGGGLPMPRISVVLP